MIPIRILANMAYAALGILLLLTLFIVAMPLLFVQAMRHNHRTNLRRTLSPRMSAQPDQPSSVALSDPEEPAPVTPGI
jgi:hypothetical protein